MDFSELSFGERLRLAREGAGITQNALAQTLGIKQNQISVWEKGISGPKRERLPALAAAVKTTIDWLMEGKGKPPRGAVKAAATLGSRKRPPPGREETA